MGLRAERIIAPLADGPVEPGRSWTVRVAWEPVLRLAARSLSARAAWVRVDEEVRIVSVRGALPPATEAWLTQVSRRASSGEMLDETSTGARALGIPLGAEQLSGRASVGVLFMPAPSELIPSDCRAVLGDVARSIRHELSLLHDADSNANAVYALSILSNAVSNMQLGVTITDAKGRIVYTNPAEAKMHGYLPEELIGQPAHMLAPPTLRRAIYMTDDGSDTSWTRESVNRHRGGREFPVLLWSDVIEDRDGGFSGVVTCSEDLTHRREVEAALRRSESMFRAIFDDAPVGLALLGDDSWIVRANPRLCSMLGIDGEPSPERRLVDFIHPDDVSRARGFYTRALADTHEASQHEHRLADAEGHYLWAHATISPILDANGRGKLWIALIEDTTKRRALEEQFRHSQKMEAVGRLAGGVAHDFNNLLTAIRGISDLLLLESPADHPMAPDIREIRRVADTAAALTAQLLAFSRRQITQYQLQDLNEIVCENENMLRRLIGDEIQVEFDLGRNLPLIMADQSQIEQVILNLLVNARDATPAGGRIRLETRYVSAPDKTNDLAEFGTFIEIAVQDTGSGIDPVTLEQIFDPFFTTKEKGRGTGLGLSTVYGIVRQAGGHVGVDSAVGEGTTFRIWLPVANTAAPPLAEPPFAGVQTILVMVDDEMTRRMCSRLLAGAGCRVLMPTSGNEAIQLAEAAGDRIDLLLIDPYFAGESGTEIARRILAVRDDVIVVMTSTGNPAPRGHNDDFHYLHAESSTDETFEVLLTLLEDAET